MTQPFGVFPASSPRPPANGARHNGTHVTPLGLEKGEADIARQIRRQVAEQLTHATRTHESTTDAPLPVEQRAALTRELIGTVMDEYATAQMNAGRYRLRPEAESRIRRSVADALLGAGGLQPLLSDERIEDITANGCDQVFVRYADGSRERVAPIADSDAEMVELIRRLAVDAGRAEAGGEAAEERRWDRSAPILNLQLPDGSRLHAIMAVTRRPALSIRRHRFMRVTLADQQALGTVNPVLRELLAAGVRARLNILVAGRTGSGKTQMLRALAAEIPPHERIVTIEDTYELALDVDQAAHPNVVPLQTRQANLEGEGEMGMAALFRAGLRMLPDRVVVGEVLGGEAITMLNAMSQGNDGSLGTIHASSSAKAFRKLVVYAAQAPERPEPTTTNLLIADALNLVVHLGFAADDTTRVVTSVREVLDADGLTVSSNEILRPGADGRAVPGSPISTDLLTRLRATGFDPGRLNAARAASGGGVVPVTLTVPLAALLGLGTAIGLVLVALGLTSAQRGPAGLEAASMLSRLAVTRGPVDRRRLVACLAVGSGVGVVTRWPVAAVLSVVAAWCLPVIIGPDRDHARAVARMEAVATWAESLRDGLSGAAGLDQAITTSAIEAPAPIRDEVSRLATRLHRGWRIADALRAYAAEVADPTNDLAVAGLLMAARGSAGQLGDVLGELATSARAKVASRQRTAASRRRTRTSARVIVAATLVMAAILTLINRGYLRPFDTPLGQLVLLASGSCFGFAFWWLARLMRNRDAARILVSVAKAADLEAVTS